MFSSVIHPLFSATIILVLLSLCFFINPAQVENRSPLTFSWEWIPGDSGYTSGPGGDIAYDLYMRSEWESDYAFDYPLMAGINSCWWSIDRYHCQVMVDPLLDAGETYHFVVLAYWVEDEARKSAASNQVSYVAGSGQGDGGGGCFLNWGN